MAQKLLPAGALPLLDEGEAEWRRLTRHLARAQDFWLGILFTRSSRTAGELWSRARRQLLLQGTHAVRLRTREPAPLREGYSWLEAQPPSARCCWIEGITGDPGVWLEAWTELLVLLNRNRERLWKLEGGLMLVLPSACKERFRQAAPDLWSIRGIVLAGPEDITDEEDPSLLPTRATVERLQARLLQGIPSLVCAPPGAGASTLRWQLTEALLAQAVPSATVDLRTLDAEDWLASARSVLLLQLGERGLVSPEVPRRVVLFVDSVQRALQSPLAMQQLSALLREAQAARLTLCLLGAVLPAALRPLLDVSFETHWLGDLTPQEIPWSLWTEEALPAALKEAVHRSCGGVPSLTRRLVQALSADDGILVDEQITKALEEKVLAAPDAPWFGPIDRLEAERGGADEEALGLYQRLLVGEALTLAEDEGALRLWGSGLINRAEDGSLGLRSMLHARLYGPDWAEFEALLRPTAPVATLEGDYGRALLHLVWASRSQGEILLLGSVELLPWDLCRAEPAEDDQLTFSTVESTLRVEHRTLSVEAALAWYCGAAADSEEPAWPKLRCAFKGAYPFRAAWHGTPRLHRRWREDRSDVNELIGRLTAEERLWLEQRAYATGLALREWLGSVVLVAPNPVFRCMESRLDAGDKADNVDFRLWRYASSVEGRLSLLLREHQTLKGSVYRLPLSEGRARLVLDHRLHSQEELTHDALRGALEHDGVGAFIRSIAVGMAPDRAGLVVSMHTGPAEEEGPP